jgi:8-oxo-dGTP pyrophosphatase MutT (NUDIX family)
MLPVLGVLMPRRDAVREVSAGSVVFRRGGETGPLFLLIRDSYGKWGLPKGHLEEGEAPAEAAVRETAEEVGLRDLRLVGPIRVIDWWFRDKGGRLIHKYCHFFLLESTVGDPVPQADEGISQCRWCTPDQALGLVSYANAREVLRCAGEMVRALHPSTTPQARSGHCAG